ncbi:conserved Plasmodium protein, unknown function [Plasmodium ovale wallikeri]|uniref:Uncharacterized protein n=2 Tax=Plasmodium ovale TaxID=36330 RepID=A0A1A8ZG70_PLAOA|nr:conserved Plasmodium protein, unknown function [Plasmodium ovale wallikeri]SBT46780.1 conserved Plasmodium protein, unknown function [Plasmodium ovale wallikeri]SBT82199.1 conserved Plasmodium protein, unknown function [Plasmodium ovale]
MCTLNEESEEIYRNVMQQVLDNVCKEKLDKFFFLIKQKNSKSKYFSLGKIKFRDDLILKLNDNLKEGETFDFIFNNSEILHKKVKKKRKEDYLINKIKTSDKDILSDQKIVDKLNILLKRDIISREDNLNLLHNSYSFYDDKFCKHFYITDVNYDFEISTQINNLSILSLSKYSQFFLNILNDLKGNTCKNFKELIKENVKIEYDHRLLNADTSGKRKRKTIYINKDMVILKIFYKNNEYKIKSKINGLQVDINEHIVANPHIFFTNTQESWVVIVKRKKDNAENWLTPAEYEDERKDIIEQYNSLLDSFEKKS